MKASLAYYQGKFNHCNFAWLTADECKITVIDDVNHLSGSFTAEYDTNRVMINVKDDTEMQPTKGGVPLPPVSESGK